MRAFRCLRRGAGKWDFGIVWIHVAVCFWVFGGFLQIPGNAGVAETLKGEESVGLSKLRTLERLVKAQGPILSFSDEQYSSLVLEPDRAYHVIVLVSVSRRVVCEKCREAEQSLRSLARAYHKEGFMYFSEETASGKKTPVFFVTLDVEAASRAISMHKVTAVPFVAFVPKTFKFKESSALAIRRGAAKLAFPEDLVLSRLRRSLSFKAALAEWVNEKTGARHIRPLLSTSESVQGGIMASLLVGVACYAVWMAMSYFQRCPVLLALSAIAVEILACSALCWSVLHGFEWAGFNYQTNRRIYISSQRRHQYVAEGLLMSFLSALCGLAFLCAGYLIRPRKKRPGLLRCILALFCVGLGAYVYQFVVHVAGNKTGISNANFFPPSDAVRGPLRMDRGNSF